MTTPARIADHVGVTKLQAKQADEVHARVHACEHRDFASGPERHLALVEACGVLAGVLKQIVGRAHD